MFNLCFYFRTRMHLYTKRYIDALFFSVIFEAPQVNVIKWADGDIAQYKV